MGSLEAMREREGSRNRYFQTRRPRSSAGSSCRGHRGAGAVQGSLSFIVQQLVGGLRAGMGYLGARSLAELRQNAKFVRVSSAGLKESHVHDVTSPRRRPTIGSSSGAVFVGTESLEADRESGRASRRGPGRAAGAARAFDRSARERASTGRAPGGNLILILDFGSQYTQLIARRVRELHVYCEIHPFDLPLDALRRLAPAGVILSAARRASTPRARRCRPATSSSCS